MSNKNQPEKRKGARTCLELEGIINEQKEIIQGQDDKIAELSRQIETTCQTIIGQIGQGGKMPQSAPVVENEPKMLSEPVYFIFTRKERIILDSGDNIYENGRVIRINSTTINAENPNVRQTIYNAKAVGLLRIHAGYGKWIYEVGVHSLNDIKPTKTGPVMRKTVVTINDRDGKIRSNENSVAKNALTGVLEELRESGPADIEPKPTAEKEPNVIGV